MFINTLIKKLFENEYKLFYSQGQDITESSPYFGFIKQVGGIAYVPVIINTDIINDYNEKFSEICEKVNSSSLKNKFSGIVFVGLFTTKCENANLEAFCINNSVDFNENINYIKWYINTDNNKLICGKNQPDKVDVIQDCINIALNNQSLEIDSIASAYKSAMVKNNAKIKSNNIFVTVGIIFINLVVILAMELMGGSENIDTLIAFGALDSSRIFNNGEYYRLFTHIFLHIGWMHFFSNSLSLYIFGSRVERYYGKINFLIIYILSGIFGGIIAIVFNDAVSAGASGAIFGLMGAVFNYIVVRRTSMAGFDKYIIYMFAILAIGSGFLISGVNYYAHIGGFISGFLVAFVMNRICTD